VLTTKQWKQTTPTSIESIIQNENFSDLQGSILGFNTDTIWFKVELNQVDPKKPLSFKLNEISVAFIEVYQDQKLLYSQKDQIVYNPLINNLSISNSSPVYFKIKFHNHVYFDLNVAYYKTIENIQAQSNFSNGWYYGFVFMVFVVNLFFYFSLKNTPFLSYSVFVAFINLGISYYDGTLGIWFNISQFESLIPLIHFVISLTGFWFASGFLNLHQSYPKSKFISLSFLGISGVLYIVFLVTNSYLYMALADLFAYLVLILYWFMGLLVFKKHEYARFFVLGYVLIMFAGLLHLIPLNFGAHLFPLSYSVVKIGGLFEMLILSYAITYRVKTMQNENNQYKDELNTYMNKLLTLEERLILEQPETEKSAQVIEKIKKLATEFDLTDREVDVLLCIANQSTNTQIAEELFISINTVKYHTRNIYQKLNINNKADAINLVSSI
ncbi:MAG: 7TM diverse intracellular signaling domain-containing protein, partial [Salibacteraceae bacterium]